ncbi:hypothetical protein G7Y79_00021g050830 [Physcia stellaris]|nr:hypothetical protein G7Y79_00021g050830 [Physcia stellaris]
MDEEHNTHQPELSSYVSIFNTWTLDQLNGQCDDTPQAVDYPLEKDQQNQILDREGNPPDTAVAASSEQERKDMCDSVNCSRWTCTLAHQTWVSSQDEQAKTKDALVSSPSEYYLKKYSDTRNKLRDVQRGVKALFCETLMRERKAFLRAEKSGVRPALVETNLGIEWYTNRDLKKAEVDRSLREVRRKWRSERCAERRLRKELIKYDIEGQLGKVAHKRKAIGRKRWGDGGRGWLGIRGEDVVVKDSVQSAWMKTCNWIPFVWGTGKD